MGADPFTAIGALAGGAASLLKPQQQSTLQSHVQTPQMPQPRLPDLTPTQPSLQQAALPMPSSGGGQADLMKLLQMMGGQR